MGKGSLNAVLLCGDETGQALVLRAWVADIALVPPYKTENDLMPQLLVLALACLTFVASCSAQTPASTLMGQFQVESDLFLAQFDSKTDVDDLHSVAAVATMLADARFSGVRYHAVAGAYGTQEGLYVPANELFEAAFGENWSDAHTDFEQALGTVSLLASNTLRSGGDVWIAEAGQSDFSAALIKHVKTTLPGIDAKRRIHVVQHSEWNESSTSPNSLMYVKEAASYHKIPDGNAMGNGSPGFRVEEAVNWRKHITAPDLVQIWELALGIASHYNGRDDRYLNAAIASGGLDFSDVSETCWIFGFDHLVDAEQFFKEFASP